MRTTLARLFIAAGVRIAPTRARQILQRLPELLVGIDEQINVMGRTGGVVTLPWHTTPDGKRLARTMNEAMMQTAREVRYNSGRI